MNVVPVDMVKKVPEIHRKGIDFSNSLLPIHKSSKPDTNNQSSCCFENYIPGYHPVKNWVVDVPSSSCFPVFCLESYQGIRRFRIRFRIFKFLVKNKGKNTTKTKPALRVGIALFFLQCGRMPFFS